MKIVIGSIISNSFQVAFEIANEHFVQKGDLNLNFISIIK
jgi:hypothetical protein